MFPHAYSCIVSGGRPRNLKMNIVLPRELVEDFDSWWRARGFMNRSDAIRWLMRQAVKGVLA